MKFSCAFLSLAAATLVSAKNILLTNDDGWASTGIRAAYRELTDAGHNVYLVAPVEQRSGYGGTFMITYTTTLLHDTYFGDLKEGDPAWGHEVNDDHIWYFNGTPAACVAFGLDYLLPTQFADVQIDAVVAGPNEGNNVDIFYTGSGTEGATYNAVYRGIPAVAFSGANTNNSYYVDSLTTDPSDPQNIYASKIVQLMDTLFASQGDNNRTLPLGIGINVNFPLVGSDSETGCVDPQLTPARLTGADVLNLGLAYNSSTGLFSLTYVDSTPGANVVYHGDGSLPSEAQVIYHADCLSDIAVFSVDYTANLEQQQEVNGMIESLLVPFQGTDSDDPTL